MSSSTASEKDLTYGERYEMVAAEVFAKHMWPGAEVVKREKFAAIDVEVLIGGTRVAFVEVKRRRVTSDAYDTTAVHWKKYLAGRNLLQYYGLPVLALVVFDDRAGYFSLSEIPDAKEFIARPDRGGAGHPHAMYKLERFTWLEEELRLKIEAEATR